MVNDVLQTVLREYIAAHPTVDEKLLAHFCQYAQSWLADSNIVGIGVNDGGVSLKLGNGAITTLFTVTGTPLVQQNAICITGQDSGK
jgi:hypothetical protein